MVIKHKKILDYFCQTVSYPNFSSTSIYEPPHEKTNTAYAKPKAQLIFAVAAKLISAFGFASRIVQSCILKCQNFQHLAINCACTALFVSYLFGNHVLFSREAVPIIKIKYFNT